MTFAIRYLFSLLPAVLLSLPVASTHAVTSQTGHGVQHPAGDSVTAASVIEFYNPDLDNYFITADPAEQAFVDTGAVGRWQRTGQAFKAGGTSQVCRFYGNGATNPSTGAMFGPNSHFYTVDAGECGGLKASFNQNAKSWKFESNDFSTGIPVNGVCASGEVAVSRLYNNGYGRGVDSNHRFTASATIYQQMIAQGWIAEGVVMCAPADAPPTTATTVTSVTPDLLMFSKTTRFTVAGQNLDRGLTLVAATCGNIVEAAGGTAVQRIFSCTPLTTGAMPVAIRAGDGSTLASINPVVPLPQVTLTTSMGDVVLELYPVHAPLTVGNFLQYVAEDFFKDKIFHRVISNFMIQGGGFNAALQQASTRAAIRLEAQNGLSNVRGTVAMARTSVPDSATSQFYINVVDNIHLDTAGGGYAVFGKVVGGMSVVDQIKAVPTQIFNGMADVPVTPVLIKAATQTQ